jgi:hypothetical protein
MQFLFLSPGTGKTLKIKFHKKKMLKTENEFIQIKKKKKNEELKTIFSFSPPGTGKTRKIKFDKKKCSEQKMNLFKLKNQKIQEVQKK